MRKFSSIFEGFIFFISMNVTYLYYKLVPFNCIFSNNCNYKQSYLEITRRVDHYFILARPFSENLYQEIGKIDIFDLIYTSTIDVVIFAFPIIISGPVSKCIRNHFLSILVRIAGLLYFIVYNTLDAIDAWNEWHSLYKMPHPTLTRFVTFGIAEYLPFVIAASLWLFRPELMAAFRHARDRRKARYRLALQS